jgi:hypothetical protein
VSRKQIGEHGLAALDRLPPEVLAVELDQIEGAEHGGIVVMPMADQIEDWEPVLIDDDRLAVERAHDRAGTLASAAAIFGYRAVKSVPWRVNSRTRPAFLAVDELEEFAPLRAWLFRIAHNRALDLLRSRAIRAAAHEVADPESPDPVEVLMRREAVETAVSRLHIGAAPLEHQSRRALPVWDWDVWRVC